MTLFAPFYLNSGYTVEGEQVYLQAIDYQRTMAETSWPSNRQALLLLKGLAMLLSKNGKMEDATETTKALHDASMKLLGPEDENTSWAVARLPVVRDRKVHYAENEERAVIASRGEKLSLAMSGPTPNEPPQSTSQDNPRNYVPDPEPKPHLRYPSLNSAASQGDIEGVRLELYYGRDINELDEDSVTALQAASTHDHGSIVQLLLSNGVDVNMKSEFYGIALHVASYYGRSGIVEMLLNNGADVNINHEIRGTALHDASSRGYSKIVEMLLNNGADVNISNKIRGTALHDASEFSHCRVAEMLLSHGADVNDQSKRDGTTALIVAVFNNDHEMVRLLLANGADVSAKDSILGTAMQATRVRSIDEDWTRMRELLIAAGAHDD